MCFAKIIDSKVDHILEANDAPADTSNLRNYTLRHVLPGAQ